MIKILFATTVFDQVETGPGTYARYLWEAFRDDSEIEFHLVAPVAQESHPRLHQFGQPKKPRQYHAALREKVEQLVAEHPDFKFVHSNNAHSIAGAKIQVPIICQVNDYEVAGALRNPLELLIEKGPARAMSLFWRHWRERMALADSARIICNSDFVKQQIIATYGLDESRCQTIYKAVDVAGFEMPAESCTDPWPVDRQQLRLVFIGSNWQIKGLDYLLEALSILTAEFSGLQLCVIGAENLAENTRIRQRYAKLEQEGNVFYAGRKSRSEIPKWLWHSDICLLPSRQEALGVSVLEAMAAGVPVIASDAGGIPEMIDHGTFGAQFSSGNVPELVEKLKSFITSATIRQRYAEAGKNRVQDFSRDLMIEKVRKLYLQ